jgi:hypothetical protein
MLDLTVTARNDDVDEGGMTLAELEAACKKVRNAGADDDLQPVVRVHRTGLVRSVSAHIEDDEPELDAPEVDDERTRA